MGERLKDAGLPDGALRLFFAQMLRDAFALEGSGVYKPFPEIAAANLAITLAGHGRHAGKGDVDRIMAAFAELPAHPDVHPAFERTKKLLARAGLQSYVDRVISIDEKSVQRLRPHRPEPVSL